MRILRNIKSLKIKIVLILFVLLILGFSSHYKIQIKALKEMYEPYNFPYPQATEHFIKAMSMATYIHRLHTIVDYDNPIMKPFLNQLNEEYEKGKSLLPKESAEDVYWYVIVYRQIYGIGGVPDRRDMSLSFKENLKTKEDFKKNTMKRY